jgi:uncharacterized membrane protein YedE/YeeE
VFSAIVTVALTQASQVLDLPILTETVATLGATAARLAVALVLLVAGIFLASAAARAVQASNLRNARGLALAARVAILFFAGALALRQAGLPAEIVTIAFGAVVGALAIGLGVALGVGGRHAAARMVGRMVDSFEDEPPAQPGPAAASPVATPPGAAREEAPGNPAPSRGAEG